MKYLLTLCITVCMYSTSAFALHPLETIYLAESQEHEKVVHSFNDLDNLSLEDLQRYFADMIMIIRYRYDQTIPSIEELKKTILCYVENEIVDPDVLHKIEYSIDLLMKECVADELAPLSFCKVKESRDLLQDRDKKNGEIKGGVAIGLVQMLCGSLLFIIPPLRAVGVALVTQGFDRMLSATEKQGQENQQRREQQERRGLHRN